MFVTHSAFIPAQNTLRLIIRQFSGEVFTLQQQSLIYFATSNFEKTEDSDWSWGTEFAVA